MKLKRINLRDPFIIKENSRYYLYGTYGKTAFIGRPKRLFVYESDELTLLRKKPYLKEKKVSSHLSGIGLQKSTSITPNTTCL